MNIPIGPGLVEIAYFNAFSVLRDKIMVLHRKQIEKEKISGKGDDLIIHKLAIHHSAIAYVYLLWWFTGMAGSGEDQDIEYWKTEYDYNELKICFSNWNIDLDSVLDGIMETDGGTDVVIPEIPGGGYLRPFKSDLIAGINGVGMFKAYYLSDDNVYGMAEGTLRVRVGNSN